MRCTLFIYVLPSHSNKSYMQYKLTQHYIPAAHRASGLSVICGLCNLILCVFTQLPEERVLCEQIGCSNSQSVTFPHPGC